MTIDARPFSQVLEDLGQGDSSKLTLDELVRAFGERGISAYSPLGTATGALAMIVIAGVALLIRTRPRALPPAMVTP